MLKGLLFWLTLSLLLAACSEDYAPGSNAILPQYFDGIQLRLESRPEPVRAGMNEFLVIATTKRGLAAYNMVISLRTREQSEWRQAIEDGESGVYRRALLLRRGDNALLVEVRQPRRGKTKVFRFPIQLAD